MQETSNQGGILDRFLNKDGKKNKNTRGSGGNFLRVVDLQLENHQLLVKRGAEIFVPDVSGTVISNKNINLSHHVQHQK